MKKIYIAPQVEVAETTMQYTICQYSVKSTWGGNDPDNNQEFVNDIWHNEGYDHNNLINVTDDNGTLDSQSNSGLWE